MAYRGGRLMSLILEALRKSEAERRRAAAPDLHAPVAAPLTRQSPLGPVLVTLAGFALLAGTWFVGRTPAPVSAPADEAAEIHGSDVGPDGGSPPEPVAAESATATDVAATARSATTDTPPAKPAARAAPAPAPPKHDEERAVATDIAPARPERPRESAIATDVAPARVPSPPAADALPGLETLAPGERAALPPLKLSMHVWSADPARRFAIVDGQRVTEGALLGGGTVAEIRPDGLVLDVAGRRVLLPRP
jgi:general secretion pathway protein B